VVGLVERTPPRWRQLLTDSGAARPQPGYRLDLVTTVFGFWFTAGLFLDAWAHNNLVELESFFTPWHAVFYSGFTATAAWILWAVWRNLQAGRRGLAAVPVGYGLSVLALGVFAVAGAGDYLWHTIFGIEQNLTILFSPTHLALIASMFVILTGPVRAGWNDPSVPHAPSLRRLLPVVLATAFSTTLVLLLMQYGNVLALPAEAIVDTFSYPTDQQTPLETRWRAAGLALNSLVLVAPLLFLARRWRLPFGTATIVHLAVAGLSGAIAKFDNASTILGLVAAGVLVDVIAAVLRPTAARHAAYWAFGALAPLVTWALYFGVGSAVAGRVPSVVELWTGGPVVAALLGLLLAALMNPRPVVPDRVS